MTDEYKFIITGTDATKKAFRGIRKNLTAVRAGINSTQVKIAALAGAAGLGALVARSLAAGDALAKTSDLLGIATEKMAGLRHAAELTGTAQQALDMGLQRMVRRLGQIAAVGSGEASVALDQLGISFDELKGRKPDEQFALIAEKMKGVADQTQKIFITQKLFDSEGVKLLNLLDQGADGIGAMIEEAGELGIALNRVDLAKMEAANDAMLRGKRKLDFVETV